MPSAKAEITCVLINEGDVSTGGIELYEQWKNAPQSFLWMDVKGSQSDETYRVLESRFAFEEADLTDAMKDRHPPRFSGNAEQLFIILKPLDSDTHDLDFTTQQLSMFAGVNYLVTRHNHKATYIKALQGKLAQGKTVITSPYQIFTMIAARMVSRYGNILLDLEQRLDVLEDELQQRPEEKMLHELIGYNTALRKMRRIMNYHLTVLARLQRHVSRQNLEIIQYDIDDIVIDAERFKSLADLYQDVVNDLIDGYISLNAHQLNQVMRVLTVVTVMFLPLGLLVGIYGMNFEYIPELKSEYGYFYLLGFMATTVLTLVFLFRKKRWL
jgi:magnesium transporter